MGLLQQLPTTEQVTSILIPIMGDGATGEGVAGVLSLLEGIDPSGLSGTLLADLDQAVSTSLSVDTGALTGGALDQFRQAMAAFPADPVQLVAPLSDRLTTIQSLSAADLPSQLLNGIDGLQDIESLIPANTGELVAGAAERLTQLKGEFISGEFGELRQWSESVGALYAEIEPLLTSDAGSIEDRLVEYLREKITDLVQLILPQESLASAIAAPFDAAISGERLEGLNALKVELVNAMNLACTGFEQGNFTNTAHLAAAQDTFRQFTEALSGIATALRLVLDQEIASAEGLSRALQRQLDEFAQIEIVDLGNIKDKFTAAIGRIEEAIEGLDLDVVRETIDGVFAQVNDAIGQFDLGQLTARLSDLQAQLQSVLNALDGVLFEVIASVRNLFTQLKEALRSVASALGSYDEEGNFQFQVQQEIESFLKEIQTALQETIRPLLDQFKTTVGSALQGVQDGLAAVGDEIEAVKSELQQTLQGVHQELEGLDVQGTLEGIRQQLDGMLGELGAIDFDPVVDPVVAEINEMRDALSEIDVSSLSDFTRTALRTAVEVVIDIDFADDIADALLDEIDDILEIPRSALDDLETGVGAALQQFGELAPETLLAPLDDLFDPITEHLDALDLESLLDPLDDWYERALQQLDDVSPAALLQPLVDLYDELQGAFDAISPAELIRPLQEAIDDVKAEIQAIDLGSIAAQLGGVTERVKGLLDELSPESLLDPLVNAFDKIMGALDRFDPGALLSPFADVFNALVGPLANLTADHARLIAEIFGLLRGLLEAFDPQHIFQVVREGAAAVQSALQQLNVGGLIAELRGPHQALEVALQAGGVAGDGALTARVEGLNPMRDPTIGQVVSDFQRFQSQISALAEAQPPEDLVGRYQEVRPRLESLIPTWAQEDLTPEAIRRAFERANPLSIEAEVEQLYETIKEQVRNFDPRIVQDNVRASFDQVKTAILALDPETIVGQVQEVLDALTQRLDAVNLQFVADELEDLAGEVQAIVAGLDPRPIVDQLQELVDEVTQMAGAFKPSEVLGDLQAPLDEAKDLVGEFAPDAFKEPILEVFQAIQDIVKDVDLVIVLQPLTDRLQQLRDELEEGLRRTETAFDGMLRAIPV
jgi:hypothetical protein